MSISLKFIFYMYVCVGNAIQKTRYPIVQKQRGPNFLGGFFLFFVRLMEIVGRREEKNCNNCNVNFFYSFSSEFELLFSSMSSAIRQANIVRIIFGFTSTISSGKA